MRGNRGSGLLLNPDCARKMEALSTKTQRASSAVRTQSALCSMAVARSAGKRKKIADVEDPRTPHTNAFVLNPQYPVQSSIIVQYATFQTILHTKFGTKESREKIAKVLNSMIH